MENSQTETVQSHKDDASLSDNRSDNTIPVTLKEYIT